MSLLERIKSDQISARKTHDTVAASLLTTLIGEATSVSADEFAAASKAAADAETPEERDARRASGDGFVVPVTPITVPITDHKVIKTVKRFLKNAKQNKELLSGAGKVIETIEREIAILSGYLPTQSELPTQLSVEQLKAEIDKFRAENPAANVGTIMGHLKANFAGLYDGKAASELAKN